MSFGFCSFNKFDVLLISKAILIDITENNDNNKRLNKSEMRILHACVKTAEEKKQLNDNNNNNNGINNKLEVKNKCVP